MSKDITSVYTTGLNETKNLHVFAGYSIRPIISLFALPFTIVTLGIFSFVINGFLLLFVASVVKGFTITGFSAAFWAAILLWLMNVAISFLLTPTIVQIQE